MIQGRSESTSPLKTQPSRTPYQRRTCAARSLAAALARSARSVAASFAPAATPAAAALAASAACEGG